MIDSQVITSGVKPYATATVPSEMFGSDVLAWFNSNAPSDSRWLAFYDGEYSSLPTTSAGYYRQIIMAIGKNGQAGGYRYLSSESGIGNIGDISAAANSLSSGMKFYFFKIDPVV